MFQSGIESIMSPSTHIEQQMTKQYPKSNYPPNKTMNNSPTADCGRRRFVS